MNKPLRSVLAAAVAAVAAQASAQVVFHEYEQFGGRSFIAERDIVNLRRFGFNDRASSVVVEKGRWEVCEQPQFGGRCSVLRPGSYPSLSAIGLNNRISSVKAIGNDQRIASNRYAPLPASPVTFYEHPDFAGASFNAATDVDDFRRYGFNDSASSVIVTTGTWELCNDDRYRGRCVTLAPGRYPSLLSLGLDDQVSSVRKVQTSAAAPQRPGDANSTGRVTFYEYESFTGRSFSTDRPINQFEQFGFNDRASSAIVEGGPWEICPAADFRGRCVVLQPGRYPSLRSVGLENRISSARLETTPPVAMAPAITFYEGEQLSGPSYKTTQPIFDFYRAGLHGRVRSAEVVGASWEVCPDPQYGGQCMLLRPGKYPTLASMGIRDRIASVRGSEPTSNDDRQARRNEPLYEARVTSVRAVVGTPEQRCWVDTEQVKKNDPNIPAAIAGALLGGILGHQVGGGSGKDIATVGGAVAGAAVGARIGRGEESQEVKRCDEVPAQAQTQYWDVTYDFRGHEHRARMSAPPGPTVTVNERGELRGG
ncbi:beta/gamma crystallin-related protein [Piscinibacter sakaiensis]|uniref:beta/gamma crystallin-related protein n=1 Tax=Piscinibacter sakaiensis TaxID=1547922 RepID=UPI003AAB2506